MARTTAGVLRLVALLALLAPMSTVEAQSTLGRLSGTVQDGSGGVLPGATVTVTREATGFTQTEVTNGQGGFLFPQLAVGTYTVAIALPGFRSVTYTEVVINVGAEYSIATKLEVGGLTETVSVTAGVELVSRTPEVSNTVQQQQVLAIPLNGRDVTNLIKLQAGVAGISNRTNTTINGGRPTWTQVTLDGINIQDNFIRTNSLDFLPNRPTSDNVAEFSITTSVSGADSAGGTSSVRMVTPAGTNTFRGSVFEFNRDSRLSANSFFNNSSGVAKPQLKRNQFGGRLGGPLLRNRLFFFANYEGYRQRTQTAQNLTIPRSPDFADGVFRYVALDGSMQSVNVMQLSGLPIDPKLRSEVVAKLPAPSNVNNFDVGNSRADRLLNTAGYRFNQTSLTQRDQYTFRADFELNPAQRFEGVFSYFKEVGDRTDLDAISPDRPLVYTSSDPKRFAVAWRTVIGASVQNELRGGANLAPVQFVSDWQFPSGVLYNTALGITNPVGGNGAATAFLPQGRYTDTYQLNNNTSWIRGAHDLQLGGSWQRIHVNPYNFAGRYPVVSFGFSAAAPASVQLTSAQFPGGIAAADLANANNMAAWLGGIVTSVAQTFQVKDQSSGYVSGIPANENYTLDNIAVFAQDNWRIRPNLTLRGGLKWEYYSPLREDDNLGFLPLLGNRDISQVMLDPATQVSFTDGGFYNKDLNNFGPTVGFAWDVTDDGKTTVRGGYSLTFVNEESVTVGRAAARGNAGLSSTVALSNQFATVNGGVPVPSTPAFLTTRTLADQLALSATGVLWGIDPNLKSPHVHQASVGVQRELLSGLVGEARYVGSFGRNIWRGTDYNQMRLSPEYMADFARARSNGYLAQQAGLAFSPAFNAAVPGSQPLTTLPSFGTALLTNATVVSSIQTNQPGALADFYITSRVAGALGTFMPNSGIYAAQAIGNGGFSDYNSMQLELRRQYRNGFFGQVNYTLAHSNTNSAGTAQNRFEAFMDNLRPELNTGRSVFHVTHVMNANAIVELPFGEGKRWLNGGIANHILGGWQLGTIVAWQSGSPLSIFSGRGTINRAGRSNCADPIGCNTAMSTMSASEIKKLLGIYKQPDGRLFWIDPKVVDPITGRAVGADNAGNSAGFTGQVFFNPAAGQVGNLEILTFDGPPQFRVDIALSKNVRLASRYRLEFKGEAFNLLNRPSFFRGDMDINSTTFGRLTSVNVGARVVQLSARLEF